MWFFTIPHRNLTRKKGRFTAWTFPGKALILHSNPMVMKEKQFSLLEILLIECVFFFVFFAVLKYLDMGNPRLFFFAAFILLGSYILIGFARYIEMQKQEENGFRIPGRTNRRF
jgi:hypothetical protein